MPLSDIFIVLHSPISERWRDNILKTTLQSLDPTIPETSPIPGLFNYRSQYIPFFFLFLSFFLFFFFAEAQFIGLNSSVNKSPNEDAISLHACPLSFSSPWVAPYPVQAPAWLSSHTQEHTRKGTHEQAHVGKYTHRQSLGKPSHPCTHANTDTQLHGEGQAPLPTHIFVVNKSLSGTDGSARFHGDGLDPTCFRFGLSSHLSGNSWAESRVGVGWASHLALSSTVSRAQDHGRGRDPSLSQGKEETGQVGPTLGLACGAPGS